MNWRKRLQPGSFRGIAFHTEQASGSGGRRVAVHEYPLQEEHDTEDMGRSAGSQRLTIYLIGSDYDLKRDALINALETADPGTLIHPYLGTLRIQIKTYEWTISTRQGGYVQFNIEYVQAGKKKYPASGSANTQRLKTASDNASIAAQRSFSDRFSIAGKPAFIQDAASNQFANAFDVLGPTNNLSDPINDLSTDLNHLLAQPAKLAYQVTTLIDAVTGALPNMDATMVGYQQMLAAFTVSEPVLLSTPSRRHQAQNQTATKQLLNSSVTIAAARNIANSNVPFSTYKQAITTRDTLLEQLDKLIENGGNEEYSAIVTLQSALMRRVDEVAPGLKQVKQIQLQQQIPALALAHQLYGDANRADELIRRNQINHPSFVPAGTDLEVLS